LPALKNRDLSDNELMILVAAGDTDKLGILYEKYKMPLFTYFFRLTLGDKHASEDLVHTVFYRVIKYRKTFTGTGDFINWVFRIAHNTGIDHNRRLKHADSYRNEVMGVDTVVYEVPDIEKNERRELLYKALGEMKAEDREILTMGKIDCLKYTEIANILKISESNVKIRMFRALKKLKDIYNNLEKDSYGKV